MMSQAQLICKPNHWSSRHSSTRIVQEQSWLRGQSDHCLCLPDLGKDHSRIQYFQSEVDLDKLINRPELRSSPDIEAIPSLWRCQSQVKRNPESPPLIKLNSGRCWILDYLPIWTDRCNSLVRMLDVLYLTNLIICRSLESAITLENSYDATVPILSLQ